MGALSSNATIKGYFIFIVFFIFLCYNHTQQASNCPFSQGERDLHSIRLKTTAVTVAAVLTSILALGGIGILTIGVESDRSSAEKMELISENMERQLYAYLSSIQQSVDMAIQIAHDSLIDPDIIYLGPSGEPEQVAKLDAALKRHCQEVEHAFGSIANSTNGVVTYYYCINEDYGSNEHGFFWSKLDGDSFVKQPDLISDELDRNDIEHTTWYYSPLKAARPVWVGPYKAHFLGDRLTISYVAPIYYQGFVVGVLGMDILFDTLISHISGLEVYNTGFAFLMDRDGNVLYHPDMSDGNVVTLDNALNQQLLRRRDTGDMLIRYTRNGEPWQLAFSSINDDYKVAVTAPVSEITAYTRKLALVTVLVAVVILAVFTLITLLLMNALTKPLLRLTAASQKLIDGDYDVELNYEGNDEVGILTSAFRKMRDHLKLYISDLNSRAYTDAMTGLKNKGAFTTYLARMNDTLKREGENASGFAIIVLDCNDLKQINDHYGHTQGDIYLKNAVKAITETFTHSPVFRLGGDEFAVILQQFDYYTRNDYLAAFEHQISEINESVQNPWERVNISKGMAVYQPGIDTTVEQVLRRADAQMYEDKRKQKVKH